MWKFFSFYPFLPSYLFFIPNFRFRWLAIGYQLFRSLSLSLARTERKERNGEKAVSRLSRATPESTKRERNTVFPRPRHDRPRRNLVPRTHAEHTPSFLPFELLRDHSTLGKMTLNVQ